MTTVRSVIQVTERLFFFELDLYWTYKKIQRTQTRDFIEVTN